MDGVTVDGVVADEEEEVEPLACTIGDGIEGLNYIPGITKIHLEGFDAYELTSEEADRIEAELATFILTEIGAPLEKVEIVGRS